jgi:uncharacterized protein with PQ loop repeat
MVSVSVMSLWVPIVVSAVIVFVVSAILHMVLNYHKNDLRPLAREADVQTALRGFTIPPGDYALPYGGTAAARKGAFMERMKAGPVVIMTVIPAGPPAMGVSLALWFIYAIVVGIFAAYVSGRALAPGAHYLDVFRFAGTTAFLGYSLALAQNSIWYKRNWGATLRSMFDGLIYGLLTAGTFGWLWPR